MKMKSGWPGRSVFSFQRREFWVKIFLRRENAFFIFLLEDLDMARGHNCDACFLHAATKISLEGPGVPRWIVYTKLPCRESNGEVAFIETHLSIVRCKRLRINCCNDQRASGSKQTLSGTKGGISQYGIFTLFIKIHPRALNHNYHSALKPLLFSTFFLFLHHENKRSSRMNVLD